ncbi:unnamed protein product [Rotaria socialis]|uniref:Nuclear receptor domain-containing protein n=1 Tax=Rotaria socialis TaxID=392032 RepID=A0A818L3W3_9BILA|nr:unnamed protein product [Rotaria socialis]CAF4746014.1 unnamed protein product [Rotaria socialis]
MNNLSAANKKSSVHQQGYICTVCDAPATGFNFSVRTCMCCKAFFRRNALYGLESLQCRYATDNCIINMKTRRDCSYCRLKKCFQAGMKKESILSEEFKRLKRARIHENRTMPSYVVQLNDSLDHRQELRLETHDWNNIKRIHNKYEEYCYLPLLSFEKNEYASLCQQPIKSRIKIQHYIRYYQKYETSLINFLKSLPEIKQLSDDQQNALIKHNVTFLVRISMIETVDNQLPIWPAINLLLQILFGQSLIEEADTLFHTWKEYVNDSTCIRLLLVVLLFSTCNKYTGLLDTLHIYKIQEKYTNLLWLYLLDHYGELVAFNKFSTMIYYCLRLVTLSHMAELKKQDMQL